MPTIIFPIIMSFLGAIANCDVQVDMGRITIMNEKNCTFDNNGLVIKQGNQSTLTGLYFGLIQYRCDGSEGTLISKLTCKDCGVFCNYNQMIEGCQSFWWPYIIGVMSTFTICFLLVTSTRKVLYRFIIWITESMMYRYTMFVDGIEMNKVMKMRARNTPGVVPSFKRTINKTDKYLGKINRKRTVNQYVDVQPEDRPNVPLYEVMTPIKHPELPPRQPIYSREPKRYPSLTNLTVMALAATSTVSVVDCCDNTLFVFSNGQVCDSAQCTKSSMYDMPLISGSTVCFKDMEGEVMKIKIADAYHRIRYNLMYYTSDFSVDVYQRWSCKDKGDCSQGLCHSRSVDKTLIPEKNGTIHGYGCQTEGLGCDNWCLYGLACTWFKWTITQDDMIYPVYQKHSEIWEVTIVVDYKNIITSHTVNVNNPRVNLDGIFSVMPLYITGFTSDIEHTKNGLVLVGNKAALVTVSDVNMPQTDILGDLQISLDKHSTTYNSNMVQCSVSSCSTDCRAPASKLKRVITSMDRQETTEYNHVGSHHTVEIRRHVRAITKMLIGNVDFNNLQVEPAKCDLEISATYACTGCNILPYVVIQATNIRSEGVLPIITNCSFDQEFISCSSEPYKMQVVGNNKICSINIPSLNKTLHIGFDYIFKGSLDPSTPVYSRESTEQVIRGVLMSPGFISGILSTISSVTLITVIASLLARIFKIWQFNNMASKQVDGVV